MIQTAIRLSMLIFCLAACAACAADESEKTAARAPFDPTHCHAGGFNIYFDPWQAQLSAESQAQISAAQKALASCRIQHVRIIGMADAVGDAEDNQTVSLQRAETIAAALETGGWPRAKFEILARGEKGALVDGVEKPMRRRAHVDIEAAAP